MAGMQIENNGGSGSAGSHCNFFDKLLEITFNIILKIKLIT